MLGGCPKTSLCPWQHACPPRPAHLAVLPFVVEGGQAPPGPFIHQVLWRLHTCPCALRVPMGQGDCRMVGRGCVGSSWVLLIQPPLPVGVGLHLSWDRGDVEVECAQGPATASLIPPSSASPRHSARLSIPIPASTDPRG